MDRRSCPGTDVKKTHGVEKHAPVPKHILGLSLELILIRQWSARVLEIFVRSKEWTATADYPKSSRLRLTSNQPV